MPQGASIPEVYILWHPDCRMGDGLARKILQWLRPGNRQGLEVFYRSHPAPGAPRNGLPLPLPGESRPSPQGNLSLAGSISNQQLVILLIDANMVADQAWRQWVRDLARSGQCIMLPVALDATAYNMPVPLREMNYLRPTGLPAAMSGTAPASVSEGTVRSLLKQITESMCRLILPRGNRPAASSPAAAPPSKINVFLSHAKADGTVPARRLRDYIYSQTQLAAFYDENDIAFGAVFDRVIRKDLASPDTAALIAIRSAKYAERPWCRRELAMFRKPRMDEAAEDGVERWRLYPTLVVEAMEGSQISPGVAEMGNSPVIRWNDEDENLEELIVTTVIRDAMLAAYHVTVGRTLPNLKPDQIVIGWLPDPTTLMHIPRVRKGEDLDILYPGRGLSGLELDILNEFFPAITFISFEGVLS